MLSQDMKGKQFEGNFIIPLSVYDPMLWAMALSKDELHQYKNPKKNFLLEIIKYNPIENTFYGKATDEYGLAEIFGDIDWKSGKLNFLKIYTDKTTIEGEYSPLKYTGNIGLTPHKKLCCNGKYNFERDCDLPEGLWNMEES